MTGDYYPVSLSVAGRPCLVVGGGRVAARKVGGLLACGAEVHVIAPDVCDDLMALTGISVERRRYAAGDVTGYRLVISATGDPEVDGAVSADAEAAGVWVNSADDPEHCTFIVPSVHRDGAVTIAVSTGGASPALARWLREQIAASFGEGVGELAAVLARARQTLKDAGVSTEAVDWTALLDGPLPALVLHGDLDAAQALLDQALHPLL
jgi:precorrin-2 dehydrogenase / sirohydrochlorin ferrochelatase